MNILGKNITARKKSKYKGPEARSSLNVQGTVGRPMRLQQREQKGKEEERKSETLRGEDRSWRTPRSQ